MLSHRRLTVLVIPESGGTTYEYRISRGAILAGLGGGVILIGMVLVGLWYFFQDQAAERRVVRLERERKLLGAEVRRINSLEGMLLRLQRSNQQLRAILGESVRYEEEAEHVPGRSLYESFVAPVDRLRWGHLRTFPGLWPLDGPLLRAFDDRNGGILIAAREGMVVRAAGDGQVRRVGYDEVLGHVVEIDHGEGLVTVYGHLRRVLVAPGEYVVKGRPVALTGRSGVAPAPCLYYAMRAHGRSIDPMAWRLWL